MVFSGLLTTGDRPSSSNTSRSRSRSSVTVPVADPDLLQLPDFIHDEAQLPCIPPERPNLRELNNCLDALAAVFPDIQIEVFRELLSSFDGESRLALVADALLKNRVTWVKGRWRVLDKGVQPPHTVPRCETFRSKEYMHAVQHLAYQEFKGLSKSTINAVLAESNYSYLEARQTLVDLSSKSWRFTISSFFLRRRPIATGDAENHPLVVWRSSGQGSIYPAIRATGSPELNRELFERLIVPLKEKERENRQTKDRELAILLNNEEAEAADATHECACCFVPGAWEEFTHCNRDGHLICFRCVQHSIKEAVFGQAWQSSINPETGTLKCMAVEGSGCTGHVPQEHIRRAMMDEKKGAEILHRLDQRLAEHSLLATNMPLVRCPFCHYAEVDDIYIPAHESRIRVRIDSIINLVLVAICIGVTPFLLPLVVLSSLLCLIISSKQTFGDYLRTEWGRAMGRYRRRRRGQKFTCQNPECARSSCLSCEKAWTDVHVCNESSLVALRTQVEQAMSMAVKRVCPRCNTSFVKNAGCNKLTCPCGYKMCYVCRADLGDEGYRHFCDHFRPDGDPRPCTECDRCNLWESEDTDKILREARLDAERRWQDMEKRDLSGAERSFLETGVASGAQDSGVEDMIINGRLPTLAQVFDGVVETIFV
ncbi:E3 ubiquitin-protein ligase-like protein [Hapsidospora chrysogenum ATCC 11550]|uniref:E3 ubiquitin-protein ligase-like protein n=1 Tax=Hapsidospora chrysogenum (strain ATCC 11550 / CBS 779.69 / DSM 880 / IAM 14645 / JCM 23072 / IMI 49137) TaxID=857340 RepID=A0A086TCM9_HAPC1|nr:E3 ubiquitin-protein ligase-like protein [Hapsidospora chrysogenum ATCC 11550]